MAGVTGKLPESLRPGDTFNSIVGALVHPKIGEALQRRHMRNVVAPGALDANREALAGQFGLDPETLGSAGDPTFSLAGMTRPRLSPKQQMMSDMLGHQRRLREADPLAALQYSMGLSDPTQLARMFGGPGDLAQDEMGNVRNLLLGGALQFPDAAAEAAQGRADAARSAGLQQNFDNALALGEFGLDRDKFAHGSSMDLLQGLIDSAGTINPYSDAVFDQMRTLKATGVADAPDERTPEQREQAALMGRVQTNVLRDTVKRTRDLVGHNTVGVGSWLQWIPGTDAADMAANLETLQSYSVVNNLQQMREASPTGGALGQVSDREGTWLASMYGTLSQSQSPAQFRKNLELYNWAVNSVVNGRSSAGAMPEGAKDESGKAVEVPEYIGKRNADAGPVDYSSMTDEQLEALASG